MRKLHLLPSIVLLLLASLITAAPVSAQARQTEFTAWEFGCSASQPEAEWQSGPIFHVRGQIQTDQIVSTESRFSGTNIVIVNLTLNTETGNGVAYGTAHLELGDNSGGWDFHYQGTISGNSFSAHAIGLGTGSLTGQKVMVTFHAVDPTTVPVADPCPDSAFVVYATTGRILDPRGT